MTHATDTASGPSVAVTGELTIYTAAEWKPRLLAPLSRHAEVELDLGGVEEVDAAGLQLLIVAKKEAAALGKVLRLSHHSPAVVDALDLCGLGGFFGDPILVPSRA